MMKKILAMVVLAALVSGAPSASAQLGGRRVVANKNYIREEIRNLSRFDRIENKSIADVEFTQTRGRQSVVVAGSENVLPYLILEVSGGTLSIRMDKDVNIRGDHELKVIISAPELAGLKNSGTGDFEVEGRLTTNNLEIKILGTGDVDLNRTEASGKVTIDISGTGDVEAEYLKCNSLKTTLTGTGDVELDLLECDNVELSLSGTGKFSVENGNTEKLTARVSGTGSVRASGLRAVNVDVRLSGTGSFHIYAVDSITGTESGTGSVKFEGNPANVEIRGRNRELRRR